MGYPSDWLQWAQGTLGGIGAPSSDTNLQTLWDWSRAESGSSPMRWNNPLNTTQPETGAVSENSVGVKAYPDTATGVRATDETLVNGFYPHILANLRSSVPQNQWGNASQDLGTWGTGTGWLGTTSTPSGTTSQGPAQLLANTNPLDVFGKLGNAFKALSAPDPAAALEALSPDLHDLAWRAGLLLMGMLLIGLGWYVLLWPTTTTIAGAVVRGPGVGRGLRREFG